MFAIPPTQPTTHMSERESREEDPLEKNERDRSNFVRELVQRPNKLGQVSATLLATPPKRIVQFWDDLGRLPSDVRECMESWKELEQSGFELQVFDESSARDFIRVHLGSRHVKAFDKCYHPSMKSDYFRYSYIFVEGGFYVDADVSITGASSPFFRWSIEASTFLLRHRDSSDGSALSFRNSGRQPIELDFLLQYHAFDRDSQSSSCRACTAERYDISRARIERRVARSPGYYRARQPHQISIRIAR